MVVLVQSDDWQWLCINNKLWEEGHHVEFQDIIKACKKNNVSADDLEEVWVSASYQEKLEDMGNFPDLYDDVEIE